MVRFRKCLSCGHTFAVGGFVITILPEKCPHCGSRLTVPKLKNDTKL